MKTKVWGLMVILSTITLSSCNNDDINIEKGVDYDKVSRTNPMDLTNKIQSPFYAENSYGGWAGTSPTNVDYGCLEYYNKNFDLYQIIEGLPAGYYLLSVQGFYRNGSYTRDALLYKEITSEQDDNAILYAHSSLEDIEVPFVRMSSGALTNNLCKEICPDAFDEDQYSMSTTESFELNENYRIPNNMQSASAWFDAGYYKNNLIIKVGNDGMLKIGMKKNALVYQDWTIVDNWHLSYYGPDIPFNVKTGAVSSLDTSGAVITGSVTGLSSPSDVGIIYGRTMELSDVSGVKKAADSSGNFSVSVSNLDADAIYYYRAYAVDNGVYHYGEIKAFTTVVNLYFEMPPVEWGKSYSNVKETLNHEEYEVVYENTDMESVFMLLDSKNSEKYSYYSFDDNGFLDYINIVFNQNEVSREDLESFMVSKLKLQDTGYIWTDTNEVIYKTEDGRTCVWIWLDDEAEEIYVVFRSYASVFSSAKRRNVVQKGNVN